jgi:hypothetical protein
MVQAYDMIELLQQLGQLFAYQFLRLLPTLALGL